MMLPIMSACTIKQLNLWIDTDIGDDLIEQACVNVQRSWVKDTLGWKYWESIYDQFLIGSGYTTADEYLLDNWVYDIIAYAVAYELISDLYIQLKSSGPRTITSTQSLIAPDKMISFDQQRYQNKINERRTSMYKYMDQHRADYPLYFEPQYYNNEKVITTFPIHRAGSVRRGGYRRWYT